MKQVVYSRGRPSDCFLEVSIAERKLKAAESAFARAQTPEEFHAGLAAVVSARRNHGFVLLKRDKLRRPEVYRK